MRSEHFITLNEVARILDVHHSTARLTLEDAGAVRVKVGRRMVYQRTDVMLRLASLVKVQSPHGETASAA